MYSQQPYDTGSPIYLQIIHRIRQKIVSGEWAPGDRVPPVRDLALAFGVNPNTMQRSLSELERDGFVRSERTSGRYITTDTVLIESARETMAAEITQDFIRQMVQMGYGEQSMKNHLEAALSRQAALIDKEENL